MEIITISVEQTQRVAEILAKEILRVGKKSKRAVVIGLEGDLGGGKTTFLQGFAKGLGIKEKITSPTFVIMKKFKINHLTIKPFSHFGHFYHIDCYRLQNPKELLDLDFKEIISDPKNIVAIEWAEKIKKIIPKETLTLKFDFINRNTRKIIL